MNYMVEVLRDSTGAVDSSYGPYSLAKAENMELALINRIDHEKFTVRMKREALGARGVK